MLFHLLTIFPDFFEGPFRQGVVSRAATSGALEIKIHDLRTWTHDLHRTVDDRPFGGGEGMVLKPQPIADALASLEIQPKSIAAPTPDNPSALYQGMTSVMPKPPIKWLGLYKLRKNSQRLNFEGFLTRARLQPGR